MEINQTFVSTEQTERHTQFLVTWKTRANQKAISASDVVFYCLAKAMVRKSRCAEPAEGQVAKDFASLLEKAFTPITNEAKLRNGAHPNFGRNQAVYQLRFALGKSIRSIEGGQKSEQLFIEYFETDELKEMLSLLIITK